MASGKYGSRVGSVKVQDIGERTGAYEIKNIELSKLKESEDNDKIFSMDDEDIRRLAKSIKEIGVIQPIGVIDLKDGYYRIGTGHRRARASKIAGLERIPAFVCKDTDELKERDILIKSNLLAREITAVQKARMINYHEETLRLAHSKESRPDINGMLMEEFGIGRMSLARLKNLSKIKDNLLNLIDKKDIPYRPFVDLKLYEQSADIQEKVFNALNKFLSEEEEISQEQLVALINNCITGTTVPSAKEKKKKVFADDDIEKILKKVKNIKLSLDKEIKIQDPKEVEKNLQEIEAYIKEIREHI